MPVPMMQPMPRRMRLRAPSDFLSSPARMLGMHLLDALAHEQAPERGRDFAAARIGCCATLHPSQSQLSAGKLDEGLGLTSAGRF